MGRGTASQTTKPKYDRIASANVMPIAGSQRRKPKTRMAARTNKKMAIGNPRGFNAKA
ncbi:MAG: hypothetical protein H6Q86_5847 [candidate division NC10 bacterium]|nr:hypothetical protein [candidate division NC10 bacterium]